MVPYGLVPSPKPMNFAANAHWSAKSSICIQVGLQAAWWAVVSTCSRTPFDMICCG